MSWHFSVIDVMAPHRLASVTATAAARAVSGSHLAGAGCSFSGAAFATGTHGDHSSRTSSFAIAFPFAFAWTKLALSAAPVMGPSPLSPLRTYQRSSSTNHGASARGTQPCAPSHHTDVASVTCPSRYASTNALSSMGPTVRPSTA